MGIAEEYNELLKTRKKLNDDAWRYKLRAIWEHFKDMEDVAVNNLETAIPKVLGVYLAPHRRIHNSNMACWPVLDNKGNVYFEIYIDEDFYRENPHIVAIQLIHELLHAVSGFKDNQQYFFGHTHDSGNMKEYIGIDEAITQIFAEDIANERLTKEEDYLYFIKNIMRIMKILFGKEKLANQYLNNYQEFEIEFNRITNYRFARLNKMINNIYVLSKKERYKTLTEEESSILKTEKQAALIFTSHLTILLSRIKSEKIINIKNELQDEEFFGLLDLETPKLGNMFR